MSVFQKPIDNGSTDLAHTTSNCYDSHNGCGLFDLNNLYRNMLTLQMRAILQMGPFSCCSNAIYMLWYAGGKVPKEHFPIRLDMPRHWV